MKIETHDDGGRIYKSGLSSRAVVAYGMPKNFHTNQLKDGGFDIELVFGEFIDSAFYPTNVCDSKSYTTVKGAEKAVFKWASR
jgi:hypothetical protein